MIELSVVIPTYNSSERLRVCLQSLMHQTQPATDFEVVVVDDASTDATREMLGRFTAPYALIVLWQEKRGRNVARNRGGDAARGRYLLFLDDEIHAAPALVAEHLQLQRSRERAVVVGQIRMTLPASADWFTRVLSEHLRRRYEELNRNEKLPTWADCCRGNFSIDRSAFLANQGFAEDVRDCDVLEFAYRLMQSGASWVYAPTALCEVVEHRRIREFARNYCAAGAEYVQLAQRHAPLLGVLIGPLAEANLRERLLRQVISFLGLPPRLLGWISALLHDRVAEGKWFRFLHKYFYWRGVRHAIRCRDTWNMLMHGTPILMYHGFTDEKSGSRFVIPMRRFARQMLWLRRLSYRVIGLEELLRCYREHRLPPARSIVITIDDGYADIFRHASPLLNRYGYSATVFVVSDRVGAANTWSIGDGLGGRRLLSWEEIAQLVRNGIEVGAHTETHPELPRLSREEVRDEVAGSKRRLETRLQTPVRSFAYPYGERDQSVDEIVEQSGFWGACGIEPGLNTPGTPAYALHRVEIEGTLPLLRFLLALRTGDTYLRIGRWASRPLEQAVTDP